MSEKPYRLPSTDLNDPNLLNSLRERFHLFEGERIFFLYVSDDPAKSYLFITNWAIRVIYIKWTDTQRDFSIPLACVTSYAKKGGRRIPGKYGVVLKLSTSAEFFVQFPKEGTNRPQFVQTLKTLLPSILATQTTTRYTNTQWVDRLVSSSGWMIVENTFCATYPPKLCYPPSVPIEVIKDCAEHRFQHRLPVLSYFYQPNRCVMLRSSMPLSGASNTSGADQKLLNECSSGRPLTFYDCRSKMISMASSISGNGGYEDVEDYGNQASINFLGIPNIHSVRDAFQALRRSIDENYPSIDGSWGELVMLVLRGSLKVAATIKGGNSVLIHCSHGWDRTAQISSLVQIILDPYYRTILGLKELIQKEWCDAGHQFALRCGHRPSAKEDQVSPIFIQFIDCLHQLMIFNPVAFEYTSQLLLMISFSVYSQICCDFLGNCVAERDKLPPFPSIWTQLDKPEVSVKCKNVGYFEVPRPLDSPIQGYQLFSDLLSPPMVASWTCNLGGGDDWKSAAQPK